MSSEDRFRPVVAVDVDGVLRLLGRPRPDSERVESITAQITMRRDSYPGFMHMPPVWDEVGRWRSTHRFSTVGAAWVRDLLARDIDVVWATTWQQHANTYFSKILGMPDLPLGVQGGGKLGLDTADWKAYQLARKYPRRPLLWIDDNPSGLYSPNLETMRSPKERALTKFQWIGDPGTGITQADVLEMDEWITLAQTPNGQEELRRRRRRARVNGRNAKLRRTYGSIPRYRQWLTVNARLQAFIPDSFMIPRNVANYVLDHPTPDTKELTPIIQRWWTDTCPSVDEIIRVAYTDRMPRRSIVEENP